ncbi:hypothetical protein V4C53_02170 [Paraburkholderia azotifigens]|uniref:hypothetical protein n=1 Tax=Paraburkholderia azotifigens TaxID=2057004 RepID=UPI0031785B42
MSLWTKNFREHEAVIQSQMASAVALAQKLGIPFSEAMEPYLQQLREAYERDFPVVQVVDESDLVTRFDGPEIEHDSPLAGTVAHVLGSLQTDLTKLALSIAGLSGMDSGQGKLPAELAPRLSGLARGSIIVGIKFMRGASKKGQLALPVTMDELVKSVRQAVQKLPIVPRFVDEDSISEGLIERLPDPAERDAILVAASRIAPSGHHGINEVNFLSKRTRTTKLTPHSRQVIRTAIAQPARASKRGTFSGVMRSADLDARRFDVRNVSGIGSIRCVYDEKFDSTVKNGLDYAVSVSGLYDVDSQGRPRLMVVDEIRLNSAGHKDIPLPF